MTAPAVTAPSAPATPTAASLVNPSSDAQFMKNFGLEGMMPKEEAALPEPGTPDVEPVVEETPLAEIEVEKVPEKVAEPEKPAETTEKPKLATEFTVADAQGEIEVPDLTIKYKANGKDVERPLDKVVRLAQMGEYNERREQEVVQTRTDNHRIAQENQALQQYVDSIQKDLTALFNDQKDELYLSLKAQYAQHNTPEAQLARTQQQLRSIEQQQQDQALQQQVRAFAEPLQNHLVSLSTQHPEVPVEEIIGRFSMLTAPYLQAGRVPPSAFSQVAQIVDRELTPWVQHTHETRSAAKSQQDQITQERIKRETQAATAKTVLAKRQLARAIPGTAGTTATKLREQPQAPKYKQAGDILNDLPRIIATTG